jgi:hypothetical protein
MYGTGRAKATDPLNERRVTNWSGGNNPACQESAGRLPESVQMANSCESAAPGSGSNAVSEYLWRLALQPMLRKARFLAKRLLLDTKLSFVLQN